MTHITPTLIAHTQPSGAACSDRAGSAHNLGYLELREAQLAVINHNPDLELPEFTVLQRVQLSDIARKALDEEFDLLRIVLAALKKAVLGEEDEETLKILARLLDVLGWRRGRWQDRGDPGTTARRLAARRATQRRRTMEVITSITIKLNSNLPGRPARVSSTFLPQRASFQEASRPSRIGLLR